MKFKFLLRFVLTGLGFLAFFVAMALFFRPEEKPASGDYTAAEIEEAESLRATDYDFSDPPVINQEVDYAEGPAADWYPKGEAPILADLVGEGRLPPVEERVGPEPVVMLGVDGLGKYGGTWLLGTNAVRNVENFGLLYAHSHLVRWSPLGYPIVPHVAKSWEVLDDGRTYEFKLRRGMRWSDGAPFTADDILYWWDYEARDGSLGRDSAAFDFKVLQFRGKLGEIRKVDDYTVRFEFQEPNGIFLNLLATYAGSYLTSSPAHYLRQFHPELGEPAFIESQMAAYSVGNPRALYREMKHFQNPEHPRIWPWIPTEYRNIPPHAFVRNPYYCVVDPEGNQLPYIDRIQFDIQGREMLGVAAANGKVGMQARHLGFDQYTEFMSRRESAGTRVYLW